MVDKDKVLGELKEKFESEKKRLGFKASFSDLNEVFFLDDAVLQAGFVSDKFSRQMCHRVVETFGSWNNYLHSLLMPNPGHMVNMTEAKALGDDKKKEASKMISKSMALISKNTLVGLTKVEKDEADFIDGALELWNGGYGDLLSEVMKAVGDNWEKASEGNGGEEKKVRSGFG